ncbi:hypothetical protein MOQ_006589 [Trypanosoma cruzi marinkellei]|uniref:Uncharacterized protein n=1 Tax=Trypanosoma cruzi marinkellei TaxID=85056 RepID=K2MVC6_TRYCR|nr:hypothetical protein MOQ_006589 [Trypanosoma cruzi marinkellei]
MQPTVYCHPSTTTPRKQRPQKQQQCAQLYAQQRKKTRETEGVSVRKGKKKTDKWKSTERVMRNTHCSSNFFGRAASRACQRVYSARSWGWSVSSGLDSVASVSRRTDVCSTALLRSRFCGADRALAMFTGALFWETYVMGKSSSSSSSSLLLFLALTETEGVWVGCNDGVGTVLGNSSSCSSSSGQTLECTTTVFSSDMSPPPPQKKNTHTHAECCGREKERKKTPPAETKKKEKNSKGQSITYIYIYTCIYMPLALTNDKSQNILQKVIQMSFIHINKW